MKKIFILAILLHHFIAAAQSEKFNAHFLKTKAFDTKIANLGPGCRIRISIPKIAELGQGYQSNQYRGAAGFSIDIAANFSNNGEWGLGFRCYRTDEKEFQTFWTNRSPKNEEIFQLNSERKTFKDDEGGTFTQIKSINAYGWAVTFDDTAGDERFRTRHLRYCTRNKTNAICGSGDVGYLNYLEDKRNIDIESLTFKVLESIEFLEDAPPNQ